MSQWTIYHNPECSKSCEALAFLKDKGVDPQIVEYLTQNPSEAELRQVVAQLSRPASELVRVKEEKYKELMFDLNSTEEIVRNLAKYPELIERPIVIKDGAALVARPLERLEAWFRKSN